MDRLLGHPRLERLLADFAREPVTDLVRRELDRARASIARGGPAPSVDALAEAVAATADALWRPSPRRVINATGVVIHTNLGRAPLSADAQAAVAAAACGYSDLEYDVDGGARGTRHSRVESLVTAITGAEAALVVNNNASALLLALVGLAHGHEVIVSRGEAVEVGGGFRIPDVMRQSGATLVEVGTTNRTYARDYRDAVSPQTAALLKVHASNFRISGFTHAATLEELVALGRDRELPVLHDLGSGCLLETKDLGLAHEPMPQESIAAGADLALFSGDKLLGGPQAGIIAGKRTVVERLARHPLARALRMDKLNLAALSATLLHYLRGEAPQKIPVWRMLSSAEHDVRAPRRRVGRADRPHGERRRRPVDRRRRQPPRRDPADVARRPVARRRRRGRAGAQAPAGARPRRRPRGGRARAPRPSHGAPRGGAGPAPGRARSPG